MLKKLIIEGYFDLRLLISHRLRYVKIILFLSFSLVRFSLCKRLCDFQGSLNILDCQPQQSSHRQRSCWFAGNNASKTASVR